MQEKADDGFVPFTQWKPFHKITFVDYEFAINGKNIEFDDRVISEQLDVQEGDEFVVKIDQFNRVTLVRKEN